MTGSQEARTTMRSREGVREENSVLLVDWGPPQGWTPGCKPWSQAGMEQENQGVEEQICNHRPWLKNRVLKFTKNTLILKIHIDTDTKTINVIPMLDTDI